MPKPKIYVPPSSIPLKQQRPTFAEVDLSAIAHNIRKIRKLVGPNRGLMPMVKADGYGHGATAVARTALDNGADWLGIALPEEGWALRKSGIECPILILGPILPAQLPLVLEADLALGLFNLEIAQALDSESARRGKRAVVHVKVDTGMGRLGVPAERAVEFLEALRGLRHLEIQGIYTHFATADEEDKSFSHQQMKAFDDVCREAAFRGISFQMRHLSNTAAILDLPETFQDLVRPGIMVYGCYPSDAVQRVLDLRPAMRWKTHVAFIRDLRPGDSVSYGRTFVANRPTRVAGLLVGYADGFPILLSNRGEVLIKGVRAPVVGTVCMDITMVDVTHVPGVDPGDEVVLFGSQKGETIEVDELARKLGTISYEIFCGVGARVPRVYINVHQDEKHP
jgi:alanine racemase